MPLSPVLCLLVSVFSFGEKSPDIVWSNAPEPAVRERRPPARWDKTVWDNAFAEGVWHAGPAALEFHPRGRVFVELVLAFPEPITEPVALWAGGALVANRGVETTAPPRMREKAVARTITLAGWISGPVRLRVETRAPRYQLMALRWTPEAEVAAIGRGWLERARYLHLHPHFEGHETGPKSRAVCLEQLWERVLALGGADVHREALIGQARAVYWQAAEDHEPYDLARLDRILRQCLRYRDHPLVRQMITAGCAATNTAEGRMITSSLCQQVRPVPWSVAEPAPPAGAPAWAVEQRRLRLRLEAITRWWVEVRQQPNGELGGAWDDDVEILRSWGPVALGLGSPVAAQGIERLSDGVWNSGMIQDGYYQKVRDVEHAAEPTTDTQPLLAALHPDRQAIVGRLNRIANCAANWIAPQPDGVYRFRGAWFNCHEFDPLPSRAIDVHLNTRAVGPVLWYAYLTHDQATVRLLAKWADSWVRAMHSTAAGKPAGRIPPAVWARDGAFPVNSQDWEHPNAEWDYFQYSGRSQEAITSLFLALHELTGARSWLDAAGESFTSPDKRFLSAPEAFYWWRRLSGNPAHDRFFGWKPAPAPGEILERMRAQAAAMASQVATNFEMYTSEPLFTDRIYYPLPADYRQRLFGGEAPRGDRYPAFAITWLPDQEGFARAVVESSPSSMRLRLYHFGPAPTIARFRLWRLPTGRYQWRAGAAHGVFEITTLPQTVEIPLPSRTEIDVAISPRLQ